MSYPLLSVSMLDPDPTIQELYPPLPTDQRDRLREHIKKFGIISPLVVRPRDERFLIVDGATRHAIAVELGIPAVPCFICQHELDVLAATFLNVHRRQLDADTHAQLLKVEQDFIKHLKPHLTESLLQLLDRFPLHTVPFFDDPQKWWRLSIGPQTLQLNIATTLQHALTDYARQSHRTTTPDPAFLEDRNRLARKVHEYEDTITNLHAQMDALREQLDQRDAALAAWTASNRPERVSPTSAPACDAGLTNRFLRANLQIIAQALHAIEEYFTQEYANTIDGDIWLQIGQVHKQITHLVDKGQLLPAEAKLRLIHGGSSD